MKERPILFSAPMVRALLDDSKTQTRRIIKGSPSHVHWNPVVVGDHGGWTDEHGRSVKCPYGQPGDRLWVRETVARRPASMLGIEATNGVESAYYVADGEDVVDQNEFNICPWFNGPVCVSIHMPRWASLITLEIASVRAERLQDISEADAMAEGLTRIEYKGESWGFDGGNPTGYGSPTGAYRALWESINGPGSGRGGMRAKPSWAGSATTTADAATSPCHAPLWTPWRLRQLPG